MEATRHALKILAASSIRKSSNIPHSFFWPPNGSEQKQRMGWPETGNSFSGFLPVPLANQANLSPNARCDKPSAIVLHVPCAQSALGLKISNCLANKYKTRTRSLGRNSTHPHSLCKAEQVLPAWTIHEISSGGRADYPAGPVAAVCRW